MALDKIIFVLILCLASSTFAFHPIFWNNEPQSDFTIIQTLQGSLRCSRSSSPNPLIACKGIPYAQPPTGQLRFKPPLAASPWSGVRNATEFGNECIQPVDFTGLTAKGDEDCLYLNVYTPSRIGRRAVMFWIHGGGWNGGNGNDGTFGPDLLVAEDVVLVTINYRLGMLGFLNTEDSSSPGNYGLKDVVLALRWVQNNIRFFGGDPKQVTIFGNSAGGATVHYLSMAPWTRNLYSRAIAQSGTALNQWAFQPDPRAQAFEAGVKLGFVTNSTSELVDFLRNYPTPVEFGTIPRISFDGRFPLQFAPSVEVVADSNFPKVVKDRPTVAIENENYKPPPFIIGGNSDETVFCALEVLLDPSLIDRINNDDSFIVPPTWEVDPEAPEFSQIASEFRQLYFNGSTFTTPYDYSLYCSDAFYYYIYKTAKIIAQKNSGFGNSKPAYFYNFEFFGINNYAKIAFGLTQWPGATHTDELGYLFVTNGIVPTPGTPEGTVSARLVKMWTDFAKGGNPTPDIDSLITVDWPLLTTNMEFLNITSTLDVSVQPFEQRMLKWEELDTLYGIEA